MFSFIISLFVLSVMFSIISLATLLFRRVFLKEREGLMYPFWVVILLISVVPLLATILPSGAHVSPDANPVHHDVQIDATDRTQNESLPKNNEQQSGSEIATEQAPAAVTVGNTLGENSTVVIKLRRLLAASTEYVEHIAFVAFVFWAAGAFFVFGRSMIHLSATKKSIRRNSRVCTDERISRTVRELRERMHIKRSIRLRIFNEQMPASPCVVGLFRPTLYVEPGCKVMSDTELYCVLTHELTHLRRFDMLIRLLSIFVSSVHWFNPCAKLVRKALHEDCELSCDYNVLRAYGSAVRGIYMGAILNFAEKYTERSGLLLRDGVSGGLFATVPSEPSFIKKRYANMKKFKENRILLAVTVIFILTCVLVNSLAVGACASITVGTLGKAIDLSPSVEAMVRAYHNLGSDDYIMPAMLDEITSVKIVGYELVIDENAGDARTLVRFAVNGSEQFTAVIPERMQTNHFAMTASKVKASVLDGNSMADDYSRFCAYYNLIDINAENLNDKYRDQLRSRFTDIDLYGTYYVLDPSASEREISVLHEILARAGILEAWTISGGEFDLSSFAYFESLEYIELAGVSPAEGTVPEGVRIMLSTPSEE